MKHTFSAFWKDLIHRTPRVAFLAERAKILMIPPDLLRDMLKTAYVCGGYDALANQRENEETMFRKGQEEDHAERAHREFRATVPNHHFLTDGAGSKTAASRPAG